MKFSETIGIDISKSWIDARMHLACQERRFDNTIQPEYKLGLSIPGSTYWAEQKTTLT